MQNTCLDEALLRENKVTEESLRNLEIRNRPLEVLLESEPIWEMSRYSDMIRS